MIVLIDNYDSFSYNLYLADRFRGAGRQSCTKRCIHGGRDRGDETGSHHPFSGTRKTVRCRICIEAIQYFAGKVPVFGVCLGHQAICEAFGGTVSYAKELMHGKQKEIHQIGENQLFQGCLRHFRQRGITHWQH